MHIAGYSCLSCCRSCFWIWTSGPPLVCLICSGQWYCMLSVWMVILNYFCYRGNILLSRSDSTTIQFILEGKRILVRTYGLLISIIDFTLSRINTGKISSVFNIMLHVHERLKLLLHYSLPINFLCAQVKIYSFWIYPRILTSLKVQRVINK